MLTILALSGLELSWVQAQKADTYYLTGEFNAGNYYGAHFGLTYVLENKYSLNVGFTGNVRKPRSLPKDYIGGLASGLSFGLSDPKDHILTYGFGMGRIYDLNAKGTIRAHISLGLGYSIIKEPRDWQAKDPVGTLDFSRNYTHSYGNRSTLSLILAPKIEFPISRYFGPSLSPMLQINKDRTYIGLGFGAMIGKLRGRKLATP